MGISAYTQTLILDVNAKKSYTTVVAHQYDKQLRYVNCIIAENGIQISLDDTYTAYFTATVDNKLVVSDKQCTIVNNMVKIVIDDVLQYPGMAVCEIYFADTAKTKRLTPAKFYIDITADVINANTGTPGSSSSIEQRLEALELVAGIPDNAVTTQKIADYAVTTAKIADGAVNCDKIESNAVGATHITDGAITLAKLAPSLLAMLPTYTSKYVPNPNPDDYITTGIYGIYGGYISILLIVFVVNVTIMQISIQNNVVKLRNKPSSAGAWTDWVVVGGGGCELNYNSEAETLNINGSSVSYDSTTETLTI